jgi:hypothetical protein
MRVLIKVVHTLGIEERGPALNAMDLIAFFEQELRKIRSVLSSHPSD